MLNTTRWRKLRALHLARHPFCADCAAEGVVTPATEVHHIRPVSIERDPARMERFYISTFPPRVPVFARV
mgnify:CR=1 FL=1